MFHVSSFIFFFDYRNPQLLQLRLLYLARRVHHKVAPLARLGEGNDLADIRLALKEHEKTVKAGRDTAMRRHAVRERGQHVLEVRFILFVKPDEVKDFRLKRGVMDTNASAAHFVAV